MPSTQLPFFFIPILEIVKRARPDSLYIFFQNTVYITCHQINVSQSQEQNVVRFLQQAGFSEQQQTKQSIADN